jgi:ABC-2 type transport system ATP-binding protein
VVSHDLDLVSRICRRGVLLKHGELIFDGPIHEAVGLLRN